MSRFLRSCLALAALVALALPVHAQVGGAAVVFLQIEPDSRAAGMGNAGVGLADNASAVFWNPAGLAFQDGIEASMTVSQWLPSLQADLYYYYLSGKYAIDGIGTFGAHITYLDLGEQEYRGQNNEDLGVFSAGELAVGLSYGGRVTENFALGGGVRFIYSNLTDGATLVGGQQTNAGVSVGFDFSGLWRAPSFNLGSVVMEPNLGFNLANMGPTIQYVDGEQRDPIPTNLRFGGAMTAFLDDFNRVSLALDFTKTLIDFEDSVDDNGNPTREPKSFMTSIFSAWQPISVDLNPNDNESGENPVSEADEYSCGLDSSCRELGVLEQLTIGLGLEYWYDDLFAVRAGYFYENPYNGNREYLTFGAGIRYQIIGVDLSYIYAVEENSPLSDTIRFSLLLNVLN
ncbi:MAG: PorV/PorQ family protein [Bacteroidota bacterium]